MTFQTSASQYSYNIDISSIIYKLALLQLYGQGRVAGRTPTALRRLRHPARLHIATDPPFWAVGSPQGGWPVGCRPSLWQVFVEIVQVHALARDARSQTFDLNKVLDARGGNDDPLPGTLIETTDDAEGVADSEPRIFTP